MTDAEVAGPTESPLSAPARPPSLLLIFLFHWLYHGPEIDFITIFGVLIDYSFMFPVHN